MDPAQPAALEAFWPSMRLPYKPLHYFLLQKIEHHTVKLQASMYMGRFKNRVPKIRQKHVKKPFLKPRLSK